MLMQFCTMGGSGVGVKVYVGKGVGLLVFVGSGVACGVAVAVKIVGTIGETICRVGTQLLRIKYPQSAIQAKIFFIDLLL